MDFFWNIVIFVFGAIVGSFLNCVIYRLEKEEEFVKKRSYCPSCKKNLEWRDLAPVLSFLALGGKCRSCKEKISWQYPLVEIATGVLFVLLANFALFNVIDSIFYFVISSLLIVIFMFDLKHFIIPDRVLFPAILISLVYLVLLSLQLGNIQFLYNYFLAVILAAGFFLIIFLASKGAWIGFGDVKFAILMGLLLGFPNIIVALFSAFCLGAIIGIGLMVLKKYGLKSEIPFGPFLIIGVFVALFWGEKIINWYLGMLI